MTEKCKKEITEYVDSKGFKLDERKVTIKSFPLFDNDNTIYRGYFIQSYEGSLRNIFKT